MDMNKRKTNINKKRQKANKQKTKKQNTISKLSFNGSNTFESQMSAMGKRLQKIFKG